MSTETGWKNVGSRLDALRVALTVSWGELAERLDISRSMLDFMRNGLRNPSAKLMRKIAVLEQSCGVVFSGVQTPVVKESASDYRTEAPRKVVNMLEIEHRLKAVSDEVAAIRELIKEARDD
jgi:transcriptional regulator with XRE-family HTH domain